MTDIPVAKCDFCMAPDPEGIRVVVSKPVLIGDALTTGEWATCADCFVDLMAGAFGDMFQRWMTHAGNAAVASALLAGQTVVIGTWRASLTDLWRQSWNQRTAVREATEADRLEMVSELERFRQTHPERILP